MQKTNRYRGKVCLDLRLMSSIQTEARQVKFGTDTHTHHYESSKYCVFVNSYKQEDEINYIRQNQHVPKPVTNKLLLIYYLLSSYALLFCSPVLLQLYFRPCDAPIKIVLPAHLCRNCQQIFIIIDNEKFSDKLSSSPLQFGQF